MPIRAPGSREIAADDVGDSSLGASTSSDPGIGALIEAREPEVGDARAAVAPDEDVVGLDIAMNDAGGVRSREPASGFDQAIDDAREGARRASQPRVEAAAVDELHREEQIAVVRADVEHRDDVRV